MSSLEKMTCGDGRCNDCYPKATLPEPEPAPQVDDDEGCGCDCGCCARKEGE